MSAVGTAVHVGLHYADLRDALRHNKEFFIQFFLGDEIEHSVPSFHTAILDDMCNPDFRRVALAVPRGHAKTTMAKLAAVWHFINAPAVEFIVYLSNTASLAEEACADIADFLNSENFIAVFGRCNWTLERRGQGYFRFTIPSLENKTCILKALGMGKQVRGLNVGNRRPQVAVVDDLEDEETANSEDSFNKMKRWLYGSFIKALNKGWNKIIHIGNIHGLRSQLHAHIESAFWATRQYGALLASGKPLWPEIWPLNELRRDLAMYQEQNLTGVWFAEMMNYPMVSENALIKPEEIFYASPLVPGDSYIGFLTVDLALSKESWANKTAVAVHLWNPHLHVWQIVELFIKKGIDVSGLYEEITRLMMKWGLYICCLESYAYQGVMKTIFRLLSMIKHPMNSFQFLPIHHGKTNKTAHIASWASLLKQTPTKQPSYALTKGDWVITQQLIRYDARKTDNDDDAIDACSYGPQATMMYMGQIMNAVRQHGRYETDAPEGSYAVCEI